MTDATTPAWEAARILHDTLGAIEPVTDAQENLIAQAFPRTWELFAAGVAR